MSKNKPKISIPRSSIKENKKTTTNDEINMITQVTAEAESLKEQNSELDNRRNGRIKETDSGIDDGRKQ